MIIKNVPRHCQMPQSEPWSRHYYRWNPFIWNAEALRLSHWDVIVLMNSLLSNLICSQQALEKRQSHSAAVPGLNHYPGPTHYVCVYHLLITFCLLPGAFEVNSASFLSQKNWLCSVCCQESGLCGGVSFSHCTLIACLSACPSGI